MGKPNQPGVVPFEQAHAIVEPYCDRVTPYGPEAAPLLFASGRVLAEAILADRDFPRLPRSIRDGDALRAENVSVVPATVGVTGKIKAGRSFSGTVESGHAV